MQSSLLQQGFDLMMFGMGTVFIFLALLIVGTILMSRFVNRFLPEQEEEQTSAPVVSEFSAAQVDKKTLAIIQDAIYQHRAKHP